MTKSRENLIEAFNDAKAAWEEVREMHEEDGMPLKFVGIQKYDDDSWDMYFGVGYPDYMTVIAEDVARAKEWFDMTPDKFADEVDFFWDEEWTDKA